MLRAQLIFLLALLASGCLENKALANPLLARPGSRAEFEGWLAAKPGRAAVFARFERFLAAREVEDVVPAWQLWRQGSDWRAAGEPPFAAPPEAEWGHIVPTLRLVRDEVIPRVGAVSVWSARRTAEFNEKAGGAKSSAHLGFRAVDLVPARCDKNAHHKALYGYWQSRAAKRAKVGIGFYDSPICRVHVDTGVRHRRWGRYPG